MIFKIVELNNMQEQHLHFMTYEWGILPRVLHYTRLEKLARNKYYTFLGPFVIHEEN
jgi:hypothetical protein